MAVIKKILLGAGITVFGIFCGLAVIEIAFRLLSPAYDQMPQWNDRPEFYFRQEEAATLQDYRYINPKTGNVFRIAVVGDSYTFAPYMQFTDTFPKKLEQMLNMNRSDLRAEVINYGVPAYSTSHEVDVVKKALQDGADMILLQVTLNDPELKPYRPRGIEIGAPDRFGRYEISGKKRKIYEYWKTLGFVASRIHNTRSYRKYKEYFLNLFEGRRTWNGFTAALNKIISGSRAADKPVAAVVFPLFGLPLDESYPFTPIHEKLKAHFASVGLPSLDLYEAYRGIPVDRMQVIPGVDRHPNEIAHRIAAERIYSWLERENYLPEELKIKFRYTERMGITGKGLLSPAEVSPAQRP